jgi:hypothetical protein
MAATELSSPLIGGQAGVANEWGGAEIQGEALATFTAQADHGINFQVGLAALVGLDASFSKFISASVQGEANAALNATLQIQVPMNLFQEVGAAVRLRISAEAAAGVTLQLGLSVGDFLSLVEGQVGADSLEARLFSVFLDEVTIGGGVYAKAAASAMAYATLVVAGRAIKGLNAGEDPGFNIIAEAGAGLKAGAGFRVFFNAGIKNFPSFIGRSTDLLVDERLAAMARRMPAGAPETRLLAAFQAPAKIAFRLAFEIGYLIANEPIPTDAAGGRKISLRACQVILEESQRYLLDRIVGSAVDEIRNQIETHLSALNAAAQQTAMPAVQAFGRKLVAIPSEPFRLENAAYWADTVNAGAVAVAAVAPGSPSTLGSAALLWSSIELLSTAMKRIAQPSARASFNLAGLRTGQAAAAFSGPVSANPPTVLRPTLEQLIGLGAGDPILQQDLVTLLAREGLALAQQTFPEINDFIAIFQGPLGSGAAATAELLLGSFGGVVAGAGGNNDEDATLAAFLTGLQDFLESKIDGTLAPVLRSQLAGTPDLITELDEVLLPALRLTVQTALPQLLRWKSGSVNQTTLKEIFSSVIMSLAGRTLVVTADILSATAEDRMNELLLSAADSLHNSHLADHLESALAKAGIVVDLQDVEELVEEALRVGADVFAPLPTDTRARIRELMYGIIQTLPPGPSAAFQNQLTSSGFIPNETKIRTLASELATIAAGRLERFAQLILVRIAEKLLAELQQVIADIEAHVAEWIGQLGALINQLQQDIAALVHDIAILVEQATHAFEDARGRMLTLLEGLGSNNGRTAFLNEVESAVYDLASPLLTDNPVFALLPSDVKARARQAMRDTIRTLAHNGFVNSILGAVGGITGEVDAFFAEVSTLDPHEGLATGILNLLLDHIETRVRAAVGGAAAFDIGFTVAWSVDVWTFDILKGKWTKSTISFSERIELARVHWDLDGLLPLLRRAVAALAPVEAQLTSVATTLLNAFDLEHQAAQKGTNRDSKQSDRAAAARTYDESSSVPGTIDILEPVQSALYEAPVAIHVRLPDTPASFVGAGASEEQRVFLWLNSQEIPRAQFTVDTLLSGVPTRILAPGQSPGRWTPATMPASSVLSPVHANPGRATGFSLPPPKVGKQVGLRPTPPAITGLSITVALPLDRFEDGVNTLVAAVVNGHGQRVTSSVTFLVSPPLTTKEAARQPRLADVFGPPPDARPRVLAGKALLTPRALRQEHITQVKRDLATRTIRFPELGKSR